MRSDSDTFKVSCDGPYGLQHIVVIASSKTKKEVRKTVDGFFGNMKKGNKYEVEQI